MKKLLCIIVILLSITGFSDSIPFFLNDYIIPNADYFANIAKKYKQNQILFDSQNYFMNKENNLLNNGDLFFFQEKLFHSRNNNFYLNINLLSGKYENFLNLRNKFINVFYGYNFVSNFFFGIEGLWNETSNNGYNSYYNLQKYYFIKFYYHNKYLLTILNYQFNCNNLLKGFNYLLLMKYRNFIKFNLFLGFNPLYFGLNNFLNGIFNNNFSFQTIEQLYLSYSPYLTLSFIYNTTENMPSTFEFTFSFYEKLYLQFYYSDSREIKRFFGQFTVNHYYNVIGGVEFNQIYYLMLGIRELNKKYNFTLFLKKSITNDISNNLTIILKYTYFII